MIDNYYWFVVSIVINFMDAVMLYAIVHRFGGHKLDLSKKKVTRDLLIAITHGAIMGFVFYFNEGSFIYRTIVYTALIALTMWWTKRKIVDATILFVIFFLFMSVVQAPFFYSLMLLFDLSQEILLLIGQFLTMLTSVCLCLKVRFNYMFLLIQQKLYLKMAIFILTVVSSALMIISNFNSESMLEQMLVAGIFVTITFLAIIMTFVTAQAKIDQSSDKYHDVVNMFNGLYLSIESDDEIAEIKKQARDLKEYLTGKQASDQIIAGDHEKNIEAILYEKLTEKDKDNQLTLDLGYFVPHEKVSFAQLVLMLGTLFDNALEHGGEQSIFVELNVSQKIFELTVKNSCGQKSEKQMKKMFKKGYTTKETIGNGKGLYKLEQEVKKYQDGFFNARIHTSCDYEEQYESYYLTITVDITHKSLAFNASH